MIPRVALPSVLIGDDLGKQGVSRTPAIVSDTESVSLSQITELPPEKDWLVAEWCGRCGVGVWGEAVARVT